MFFRFLISFCFSVLSLYASVIPENIVENIGIQSSDMNSTLSFIKSVKKPPFQGFQLPAMTVPRDSIQATKLLDGLIARSIELLKKQYASALALTSAIQQTPPKNMNVDISKYQKLILVDGETIALTMSSDFAQWTTYDMDSMSVTGIANSSLPITMDDARTIVKEIIKQKIPICITNIQRLINLRQALIGIPDDQWPVSLKNSMGNVSMLDYDFTTDLTADLVVPFSVIDESETTIASKQIEGIVASIDSFAQSLSSSTQQSASHAQLDQVINSYMIALKKKTASVLAMCDSLKKSYRSIECPNLNSGNEQKIYMMGKYYTVSYWFARAVQRILANIPHSPVDWLKKYDDIRKIAREGFLLNEDSINNNDVQLLDRLVPYMDPGSDDPYNRNKRKIFDNMLMYQYLEGVLAVLVKFNVDGENVDIGSYKAQVLVGGSIVSLQDGGVSQFNLSPLSSFNIKEAKQTIMNIVTVDIPKIFLNIQELIVVRDKLKNEPEAAWAASTKANLQKLTQQSLLALLGTYINGDLAMVSQSSNISPKSSVAATIQDKKPALNVTKNIAIADARKTEGGSSKAIIKTMLPLAVTKKVTLNKKKEAQKKPLSKKGQQLAKKTQKSKLVKQP